MSQVGRMDASGASIALINSLRTQNVIIDMLIALLIPMAFAFFSDGRGRRVLDRLHVAIRKLMGDRSRRAYVRTITHTSCTRNPCGLSGDKKNDSLQKALTMFWTANGVTFDKKAQVALTSLQDARQLCFDRPDRFNPLETFRLTWLAPDNEEVDVGNGVKFRQYRQTDQDAGGSSGNSGDSKLREQMIFELTSTDGPEPIDTLISEALEWYKNELIAQRDHFRYLYTLITADRLSFSSKDKDDDGLKYKRYRLSDHKTFESLFFKEKDSLLELLSDFRNKTGKFGVAGFPHKLGLLLHGPPGTGKTSLIKALAHVTDRSIVSIPLAQIKTNSMLMDVMYDLKLAVDGVSDAPQLAFKDVIFVIEDIDAASKVVLRRSLAQPISDQLSTRASDVSYAKLASAAASVGDTGLASLLAAGRAQRGEIPPPPPPPLGGACEGDNCGGDEMGPKAPTMADLMGDLLKPRPDELNLAGILNVLDGVVDTPGRIVIMTSNHPEVLDPALIRPGRIDRQIHLGYMQVAEACQMLAHYFDDECTPDQRAQLDTLLRPGSNGSPALTPAALEQLCARFSTIDDLLDGLSTEIHGEQSKLQRGPPEPLSRETEAARPPPPPSPKPCSVAASFDEVMEKPLTGSTAPPYFLLPSGMCKADGIDFVTLQRQVSAG